LCTTPGVVQGRFQPPVFTGTKRIPQAQLQPPTFTIISYERLGIFIDVRCNFLIGFIDFLFCRVFMLLAPLPEEPHLRLDQIRHYFVQRRIMIVLTSTVGIVEGRRRASLEKELEVLESKFCKVGATCYSELQKDKASKITKFSYRYR
jgi:hypothetical protein